MGDEVLWEKRGRIRILTFNRPDAMNAANAAMLRMHSDYLQEFSEDNDASVLIFTGKGKAFSTGLDLKDLKDIQSLRPKPKTLTSADTPVIYKPIIAAINGFAVGLGCELALACDIRIAAEDARFGLMEVKRGMVPGAGGCQRLPRIVPLGEALKMLFKGDWIDAQEAYRIGLVQQIVPSENLVEEAVKLAEIICENAPGALKIVKEMTYRGLEVPLREALPQAQLYVAMNHKLYPEDIAEGATAFKEKRKPVWKAR